MGTNYYLHQNVCEHCGRGDEVLHIGKSSAGWCFALHVKEEAWDERPNSLAEWQEMWSRDGVRIKNEYGEVVTPEEMLSIITERRWKENNNPSEWYRQNHASPGPFGLARHTYNATPGDGTYDLLRSEFS